MPRLPLPRQVYGLMWRAGLDPDDRAFTHIMNACLRDAPQGMELCRGFSRHRRRAPAGLSAAPATGAALPAFNARIREAEARSDWQAALQVWGFQPVSSDTGVPAPGGRA